MRIRRVRIDSFGAVRGREYDLAPGMTVLYGPNESGKSTTMEFIREAIVSSGKKRNLYPSRSKSDSGTVVYEEGGETKTLRLEYKEVSGDRPALPPGVGDHRMFTSVFAMTPSGLDDETVVTEGDVRNRFLTVPGGERMPDAMKAADDLVEGNLGKSAASKSRVNRLREEKAQLKERIKEARARVDEYGDLSARRDALREELARLEEQSRSSDERRDLYNRYRDQRGNYEELRSLRQKTEGLGRFARVTPDDREYHDELVAAHRSKSDAVDANARELEECRSRLGEADPRKVNECAERIRYVESGAKSYRDDRRELSRLRSESAGRAVVDTTPEPLPSGNRRGFGPLVAAGAVLALAGLVLSLFNVYALALVPVGAAVAVAGLVIRRPAEEAPDRPPPEEPTDTHLVADLQRSVDAFESEVSGIMSDLSMESSGTDADLATLSALLESLREYNGVDRRSLSLRNDEVTARGHLMDFLARFGGEQGYAECLRKTEEEAQLSTRMQAVSDAIRRSGLDPGEPECPVEEPDDPLAGRIGEINVSIGEINQKMQSILDDGDIESLMDRRSVLKAELKEALVEGAVGLLAKRIAEAACEDIYSSVQPGVVSTADRYLSLMTDGRYRLDTDPRTKDLSVREGEESKPMQSWSSGLRAQVLLSVKLAIAKEMGGGSVPVVLDDVLLPFDSERKRGACTALAELSSEMQVVMFTCDAETRDICSTIDGVSVIPV